MTEPQAFSPAQKYEQFFVPAIFGPWARVLVERAKPAAGEAILDLACGTGIVARTAAPLVGPSGRVMALDLRPGMLAAADGRCHRVDRGRRHRYRAARCQL